MNYEYFLQIALAKGVGDVKIKRILDFFSENGNISWDTLCSDKAMQKFIFQNKVEIIENIALQEEHAKRISDKLTNNGVKIIFYYDDIFPAKLKQSLGEKCPPFLFYKGNINLINKDAVGFCGSRKASQKGMAIAHDCACQLVKNNIVIISGYAAGVDLVAHKAALMNLGETVFVLSEGILMSSIKKEIQSFLSNENHVFISQFMPESNWHVSNAMKRNSVIIGLSNAMILVESGKSGGTFAAGNEALSLKHPLFVIDFAQPEVSAEANPYFISKGGIPIRGKENGTPNLKSVFSVIEENPHQDWKVELIKK